METHAMKADSGSRIMISGRLTVMVARLVGILGSTATMALGPEGTER